MLNSTIVLLRGLLAPGLGTAGAVAHAGGRWIVQHGRGKASIAPPHLLLAFIAATPYLPPNPSPYCSPSPPLLQPPEGSFLTAKSPPPIRDSSIPRILGFSLPEPSARLRRTSTSRLPASSPRRSLLAFLSVATRSG